MSIAMHSACSKHWIKVLSKMCSFTLKPSWRPTKIAENSTLIFFLTDNNQLSFSKEYSHTPKNVISHWQPAACGLSRISYAYFTWVAMWDRFLRQGAYIGITRSCMRWYVRKIFGVAECTGKCKHKQTRIFLNKITYSSYCGW